MLLIVIKTGINFLLNGDKTMINVEQKAKDVLANLHIIHPQINLLGLADEEKLMEMKKDLGELVDELGRDSQRMARIVGSCREDAVSSFNVLREIAHRAGATGMTDKVMREAMLAADNFTTRAGEYLGYRESLHKIGGE